MTGRLGAKKKGGSRGRWSEWEWDSVKNCWRRSMEHGDGRVTYQYGANSREPRSSQEDTTVHQYQSVISTQQTGVSVGNTTAPSNYTPDSQPERNLRSSPYGAHFPPEVSTASQASAGLELTASAPYPEDRESGVEPDLLRSRSNTSEEFSAPDETARSNYHYPVQGFQEEADASQVSNPNHHLYPHSTTYGFNNQGAEWYESQPAPSADYGSRGQGSNLYFPKSTQNVGYASGGQSADPYPQSMPGVSYPSESQSLSQYPPNTSYRPSSQMTSSYISQSTVQGNYGSGYQSLYHSPAPTSFGSQYLVPSNVDAPYNEQSPYAGSYRIEASDDRKQLDSPSEDEDEDEDSTPPAHLRSQSQSSNSVEDVAEAIVGLTMSEKVGRMSESNRPRSPPSRSRGSSSTKHQSSRKKSSQSDTKNKTNIKPPQKLENASATVSHPSGQQQPLITSSTEPPIWRNIKPRHPSSKNEPLHPNYKVHDSSKFKKGKVFKILWSEPSGAESQAANDLPEDETQIDTEGTYIPARHGQTAYHSIRRFVIVKTMQGHSLCLPIFTYGKKATSKPGVKHDHHAIIYTGEKAPKEVEGERKLHKTPIRVEGKTAQDKLLPESRLNYAKVYTVEHNNRVCFIGAIHSDSEQRFFATWRKILDEGDG